MKSNDAPELSPIVVALLDDTRPASDLSAEDLAARIKSLRQALKLTELPDNVNEQLQALLKGARSEVAARDAASTQQSAGQTPSVTEEATHVPPEPAPEPESTSQLPEDVATLLDNARPLGEFSDDELKIRIRALREALRRAELPASVRERLETLQTQARIEVTTREAAATELEAEPSSPVGDMTTDAESEPGLQPEAAPTLPSNVAALFGDTRSIAELSGDELTARISAARRLAQDKSVPEETRNRLAEIARNVRREVMSRDRTAGNSQQSPEDGPTAILPGAEDTQKQNAEAPPVVDKSNIQALDGNVADPQSEAEARAYLQDQSDVDTLADDALRTRVDGIRDLLASNELSRDTERSVRRKLRSDRDTLRARIAQKEARNVQPTVADESNTAQPTTSKATGKSEVPATAQGRNNTTVENNTQVTINNTEITTNITNLPPPRVVLADRRRPEDLDEREIRWRINVYGDAIVDDQYDEAERLAWRERMDEDRRYLRRRLLDDRERRERRLEVNYENSNLDDMEISDAWDENAPPPRDVYVDEVEDEDLVEVLVAPPRRKVERRYSVAEIAATPDLRDAVARIEINSVHFGFNEARVRVEEISKLERVGEILERILRKNPREVFLIEGHTDAVGADEYNLRLSRQRAEAIKEALTTYFVIDPRNLKTVGFGERYLKIPTADAEEENRRVSIARATALVGELDE